MLVALARLGHLIPASHADAVQDAPRVAQPSRGLERKFLLPISVLELQPKPALISLSQLHTLELHDLSDAVELP
jgi:hypothetical protein